MTAQERRWTEEVILAWWNALADELGLARVIRLTPTRQKHINQRLEESTWDIAKIETAIRDSKFLRGNNERGWKVNFDFILTPSGYVKILEGRYSNGRRSQGIQAPSEKYEGLAL
jgi:hypothetical protein